MKKPAPNMFLRIPHAFLSLKFSPIIFFSVSTTYKTGHKGISLSVILKSEVFGVDIGVAVQMLAY